MDRKTCGICAGGLASLATLLCVGCGADSLPSSTTAQNDAPQFSSELFADSTVEAAQQVEVAQQSDASAHATSDQAASGPTEAVVVEPLDAQPYAGEEAWPSRDEVSSTEAASVDETAAAPLEAVAQSEVADDSAETDTTPSSDAADEVTSEVTSQPVSGAPENEIRFAEAGQQPAPGDAGQTTRPADAPGAKRGLKPILVTPSEVPHELAQEEPAESEPQAPVAVEPQVPVVVVPQAPAVAESQVRVVEPQAPVVVEPQEPAVAESQAPVVVEPQAPSQAPAPVAQQLPQVQPQPARSPAMVASLSRADERVRHGILLAQKGALYAARREFTSAIKLISQANDAEHGTRQHTKAAIAGFLALKEANDLLAPAESLGDTSVTKITAGHKTRVLDETETEDMPPTVAAGYYYEYAREQLATAIGRQTVGSIALYGLGKIIVIGAGSNAQQLEFTGPAMALYQASLMAEPENYRAAHELGVLFASAGQLEMARELLAQSAARSPQPMIFRNLATVHTRLGEGQLAEQARQKADALQQTTPDTKTPSVNWVDPATFAATTNGNGLTPPPAAPPTSNVPQVEPQAQTQTPPNPSPAAPELPPEANVARKRYSEWNPLNLRR